MVLKKTFVHLLLVTILMWFVTVSNAFYSLDYKNSGLMSYQLNLDAGNYGHIVNSAPSKRVVVECNKGDGVWASFNTLYYDKKNEECSAIFSSDKTDKMRNANTILQDMAARLNADSSDDGTAKCRAKQILGRYPTAELGGAYRFTDKNLGIRDVPCVVFAEMYNDGSSGGGRPRPENLST